uniref:2-aminoethanethiol dioxygenase-like n=1 Tax=Hirondellea gigas TaxID=1518452 RepID=A0A2P2I7E4_9CRUS
MTSLIQRIGRLAIQTFSRDPSVPVNLKRSYLKQLEDMVSSVSSDDLSLDPSLLQDEPYMPTKAPVIYMLLYEDMDVNVCVFILRRGVRMPMHDHPGMFGLLKVVHGNIAVQSYTLVGETGPGDVQCAVKHPVLERNVHHPPISLTPDRENLHEIVAIDGPAAFLDILSPPYGEDTRLGIDRDCHYYRVADASSQNYSSSIDTNKIWLKRIRSAPNEFWCDEAEYRGPPLKGVIEDGWWVPR